MARPARSRRSSSRSGARLIARSAASPIPSRAATPGREILHQHIGPAREIVQDRLPSLRLEVEGDALFVAVALEDREREIVRLPPRAMNPTRAVVWRRPRIGSPRPGCSTLITRAPSPPRICVANGPERKRVRSRTSRPSSGRRGCEVIASAFTLDLLLQMLRYHRCAPPYDAVIDNQKTLR